jgi:hypothetical protein
MASPQHIILNMGIALNRSYFFDANFGRTLSLTSGEPDLVLKKANELSETMVNSFRSNFKEDKKIEVRGLVQFGGESIFLYEDPKIIESISSMSTNNPYCNQPIWPFIHCPNPAWPETPIFLETMEKQFQLAHTFHAPAVVAHLNAKDDSINNPNHILEQTIEAFTNPKYLELVKKYGIKVCFENNHHDSYFGLPENDIKLYEILFHKLKESGNERLIKYFGFCLDFGHFFTEIHKVGRNVEEQLKHFINEFNPNMTCFHLHTNSGNWDDHIIPIDYTEVLIKDIETKYDPFLTQKHMELLWKYLHYWAQIQHDGLQSLPKINADGLKNYWFIFEIESPYTIEQVKQLGKRLAAALDPLLG